LLEEGSLHRFSVFLNLFGSFLGVFTELLRWCTQLRACNKDDLSVNAD